MKSLADNFYDLIFSKIYPSGNLVWMTDADGVSVPTWAISSRKRLGEDRSIYRQKFKEKDCIGRFFQDGIDESAKSSA